MSKDVSQQRISGRVGCCASFCIKRKEKDTIMPKNYDSPDRYDHKEQADEFTPHKEGNHVSVNITVELKDITGFVLGPHSLTFRQYAK